MSQTIVAAPADRQATVVREATLLAGIGLSSFAALLLELALTRLFSVVLFYHYAFLAISVALLGLGAGGVFAHLQRARVTRWSIRQLATTISILWCCATVGALTVILRVPVELQFDSSNFGRLTVLYLCAAVPFFLTGLLFSVVFARHPEKVSRLYGADLCGGALACLATVPLLNYIGGPNTILFSAAVMALGAAMWAEDKRRQGIGIALVIGFGVLIAWNSIHPVFDIIYAKGKYRDPAWVEYARWNAISRIEVDRHYDGSKWIVIDADASTAIMNADPQHWNETAWAATLLNSAPALTNVLRPHGEFAIIGPGGGVDVLRAVAAGSPKVTGIEINPIIVNNVMRGRYADYARHLYELPQVDVHVSDGRSFIRISPDRYDVIQMTLVDTWASTAAGAFALSENNLYTLEAFKEYFQHLKPDGLIAITRWEFKQPREALRVVSVAMEALHQLGIRNPARHFILISDGALNEDGRPVLVLAKRSEFTADEEARARKHVDSHANLVAQYFPSQPENNEFSRLIASNDPSGFARNYKFNVAPATDDAPFFFFTLKLGQMLNGDVDEGMDWKVNLGVVVLGMVFLLSVLAVVGFLILPLMLGARGQSARVLPLTYFIAIGLGYILVEVAFIQRFVLFLGHPTYALTVVVFIMLLSSGIGSLTSRRWITCTNRVRIPLIAIGSAIVVYALLLPNTLSSLVGLPFTAKLMVSAVVLVPLGFLMGMPFPVGLRALAGAPKAGLSVDESGGENSIEWAWAMNAAASVLGSVLAIAIGIRFGLKITLLCGAAAYIAAAMLLRLIEPRRRLRTI
jgi:SAM-dependent methyltransferase